MGAELENCVVSLCVCEIVGDNELMSVGVNFCAVGSDVGLGDKTIDGEKVGTSVEGVSRLSFRLCVGNDEGKSVLDPID